VDAHFELTLKTGILPLGAKVMEYWQQNRQGLFCCGKKASSFGHSLFIIAVWKLGLSFRIVLAGCIGWEEYAIGDARTEHHKKGEVFLPEAGDIVLYDRNQEHVR